ncbi:hypothetical protein D9757_008989 [Collybiopsis confluens]|uniref:ribonuclease T2 n=1 Tax=Collybiopsis confluens TaxID=2823264 RepID=A0A8H5M005_9AGAR|nr:hypothetical protein D9757_008989 [Collybiopsis confluens]
MVRSKMVSASSTKLLSLHFILAIASHSAWGVPTTSPNPLALGGQFDLLGREAAISSGCSTTGTASCHNTSAVSDLCCFESPGGLLLQTQFWDFNPSTGPSNSWTIHELTAITVGLWPDNCDGTFTENCDASRDQSAITSFWKNDPNDGTDEEFWSHEWDTHGTCYSTLRPTCLPSGSPSGTDAVTFYETVVRLFQTLPTYTWLANQGITPSSSTTHTLTSLENALAAEAGVKPMLTCSGSDLNQIAWYFNLKGSLIDGVFEPIDSPEASSCPSSGILYPPKTGSPVSTTSPTGTSTSTGTPGTLPAKAQIHAMQSGTQVGGLLTLGTWSTQTLATMTLSGTSSSFTMSSSKGSCGVSGGTLTCGSGVTATTFSAVKRCFLMGLVQATSGGNLLLASGGSTSFSSSGTPSGETVETVFTVAHTGTQTGTQKSPDDTTPESELYNLNSNHRSSLEFPYSPWSGKDQDGTVLEAGKISWYPCIPAAENVECGSVQVPKYYSDPSRGTASIALAIYRAKPNSSQAQTKRRGSVFLNPGGPGGAGTHLTLYTGHSFSKLIGEDWDLVGFDPRGIGLSSPETRCFKTEEEYDEFFAGTVVELGLEISSLARLRKGAEDEKEAIARKIYGELVPQYRELLELKKNQGELCRQRMGDELKYMGTTTVVKDLDFISKILDQDIPNSKINYWGQSYGSIIGAYLVNMLPERAGYVVLDGIVDAVGWSSEPTHKWSTNWLADAEKTCNSVQAGPSLCPLSHHENEPWQDIESRFETFFDKLAREPLRVHPTEGEQRQEKVGIRRGVLTSGAARVSFLYNPQRWAEAAELYSAAFNGDAEGLYNLIIPRPTSHANNQRTQKIQNRHQFQHRSIATVTRHDLQRQAVTCLDSPPSRIPPSADELARIGLYNLQHVSPHFGVSLAMNLLEADIGCEFWPVHGDEGVIDRNVPERFDGPWGLGRGRMSGAAVPRDDVELDRKMLIISNTADPVTPLASGLRLNSLMPDSSVIVIQDGPGHCSSGLPSLCTAKLVRGYFAGSSSGPDSTDREKGIPLNGTVCSTDMLAFSDPKSNRMEDEVERGSGITYRLVTERF